MKFEKKVLADIDKCYATLGTVINGKPWLFYAGEGNGSLQAFHGENFGLRTDIWSGGGGTMSISDIRGREGWLFVSRGFYSMVDCKDSSIEIVRFANGEFTHEPVAHIEYLHRFGVIYAPDGERYIIAASLHGYKKDKEDWSHPGSVYFAKLPRDLNASFTLDMAKLPGDYYVNHGFCVSEAGDRAYISCNEGVFEFVPPQSGSDWTINKLIDAPISDIAVLDIDLDGDDEIAAIMPFHGNRYVVFKKDGQEYREVYSYPVENDFYHTVTGATLAGRRVFIGGARKLAADLFALYLQDGGFVAQRIDEGCGPSNAAALNANGTDYILAANRQISQAAVYICK
ncbi:MAG: hypothetical protein Q4D04_10705 [Clostridia bacterium]|nr:hypothetical protein [Clostridia bacterium]